MDDKNRAMRSGILFFLFALTPFMLTGQTFWSPLPDDQLAPRLAQMMTPEELAGQVLLLGYPGEDFSPSLRNWVGVRKLGGLKVFGWNAGNLDSLVRTIRESQTEAQKNRLQIPLFIATDQEGGWVRHIRSKMMATTPGNLSLGASGLPYDSYKTGYYIGMELRELGINMNFAPTVDIYTNHNAHVIGPRAFSDNAVTTAILSVAFYKGMDQSRVIATAKHFPGHGNASEDSHGKLPQVEGTLETMRSREFLPYHYLIKENIPSIMSGHLAYPQITKVVEPASLSSFFGIEILRKEMGFKNLLITDDLFMEGARQSSDTIQVVCEKALIAGNDLLMLSQTEAMQEAVFSHFVTLARGNAAFLSRLREAAERNIKIKLRYLKGNDRVSFYPLAQNLEQRIPNREGQGFFQNQAARSVTIIHKQRIPLDKTEGSILLVTPYESFFQQFQSRFPKAKVFYYDYNPFFSFNQEIRSALVPLAQNFDRIIFNLVTPGSVSLLKALEKYKDRITVISFLTPIYLRETPWVQSSLAVYGTGIDSQQAAIGALWGDFMPRGKLPLTLD